MTAVLLLPLPRRSGRPAVSQRTRSPPTMLHVGRGGTIAHKTRGNSFRMPVLGRTWAIKRYSNALAQDPHKRALLPTPADKTFVFHSPSTVKCHADALAQAYESNVFTSLATSFPFTREQASATHLNTSETSWSSSQPLPSWCMRAHFDGSVTIRVIAQREPFLTDADLTSRREFVSGEEGLRPLQPTQRFVA